MTPFDELRAMNDSELITFMLYSRQNVQSLAELSAFSCVLDEILGRVEGVAPPGFDYVEKLQELVDTVPLDLDELSETDYLNIWEYTRAMQGVD